MKFLRNKSLLLIIFLLLTFNILCLAFPHLAWGMLLREKSLRESFFTQLIDEIKLVPKQSLSQAIRFNYENPLGVEILFRNPAEKTAKGIFILKDNEGRILVEKEFSLKAGSPAEFYFFPFKKIEQTKGENYELELVNSGEIPLIVGYYNQNVYHYGELFLGEKRQEGVLQFQIHYEINPLKEFSSKIKDKINQTPLFFSFWLGIIIILAFLAILLAKKQVKAKK